MSVPQPGPRTNPKSYRFESGFEAHRPWLWFRLWEDFKPWQEFRCFKGADGTFRGGTQYHGIISDPRGRYFEALPFPELVEHGAEYEQLILDWYPTFRDACPYEEAVFDIIVDRHAKTVRLLETNPCGPGTFPGLCDWNNPASFNGEVLWVVEPLHHIAPVISQGEIAKIRATCNPANTAPSYESIARTTPSPSRSTAARPSVFGFFKRLLPTTSDKA